MWDDNVKYHRNKQDLTAENQNSSCDREPYASLKPNV
jgi:hypothetical protein